MEARGQLHTPTALIFGKEPPGTHRLGGWVGYRAGLDAEAKRERPSPRQEPKPGFPTHNLVTVLTKLSRL
jgi:hypothetical protein